MDRNIFNFLFLNLYKLKGHWDQFEQHATCPIKHKQKSKMKNLSYQQTKHNDLIGFQTPFQSY
jgi:hypothetical protein